MDTYLITGNLRDRVDPAVSSAPEATSTPAVEELLDGLVVPTSVGVPASVPAATSATQTKLPQPVRTGSPKVESPAEKIQRAANTFARASEAQAKAEADVERLKTALRSARKQQIDAEDLREEARQELAQLVAVPGEKSDAK